MSCSVKGGIRYVRADLHSWRQLCGFHYRTGRLGCVDAVFAAEFLGLGPRPGKGHPWRGLIRPPRTVGVLVVSHPVPNVAVRNVATGGRYTGLRGRRMVLDLLNQELRTISRVVVHPQFRGMSLSCELVSYALPRIGTVYVEALSVMGRVNPFFERAGMIRYWPADGGNGPVYYLWRRPDGGASRHALGSES